MCVTGAVRRFCVWAVVCRCEAIAAADRDFNAVYRCLLPLLPLPLSPVSPRFTLPEIHSILVNIRDNTVHGGSSVTNLHIWDAEQWLGFGSRGTDLLAMGGQYHAQAASTVMLPLQCDTATSAKVGSTPLNTTRLLLVIPVVAKEGARLRENFREWQRDRNFPCSYQAPNSPGLPDLMLLFSRTIKEVKAVSLATIQPPQWTHRVVRHRFPGV